MFTKLADAIERALRKNPNLSRKKIYERLVERSPAPKERLPYGGVTPSDVLAGTAAGPGPVSRMSQLDEYLALRRPGLRGAIATMSRPAPERVNDAAKRQTRALLREIDINAQPSERSQALTQRLAQNRLERMRTYPSISSGPAFKSFSQAGRLDSYLNPTDFMAQVPNDASWRGTRVLANLYGSQRSNQPLTKGGIRGALGEIGRRARSTVDAALERGRSTVNYGIGEHEIGEIESVRGGRGPYQDPRLPPLKIPDATGVDHSGHAGIRPHVRELLALHGDPAAARTVSQVRSLNRDDRIAFRGYRSVGGSYQDPIPVDSRRERALQRVMERAAAKNMLYQRQIDNSAILPPGKIKSALREMGPAAQLLAEIPTMAVGGL